MLPLPGVLRSWISPPSRLASSRLMARPRPVPPYLRLVLASACWNASKMIFCFSSGMPMPVSDTSKAITRRRLVEDRMLGAPAADGGRDRQPHAALLGELEGVRQQVLQHLLQALGVGRDAAAEMRIDLDVERELPVFRLVPERPRDRVEQIGDEDLLRVDRDRAGFDLRQIENVADQVEQIGAGAVDGAGEFDLLGGQIAVRVVAELLAEDQDAVERRAQLVRHVGEEFGLVLRGQRELGRLFLERAAGLLDFLVLALHLDVALGELLRLLLELLVGLLQLLLLRLQFAGELLRLLQQAFGLHRRLDAVEHDADAVGELLEEGHLQRGELA